MELRRLLPEKRSRSSKGRYRRLFWETFNSLRFASLPMPGGISQNLLARRLRTVRQSSLNISSGSVSSLLEERKIFNLGSIREKTPGTTGGTRTNVASGRIVAFERVVRFSELTVLVLSPTT